MKVGEVSKYEDIFGVKKPGMILAIYDHTFAWIDNDNRTHISRFEDLGIPFKRLPGDHKNYYHFNRKATKKRYRKGGIM